MSATVGVLLSGLAGALSVFFLGVVREWRREDQERRGMLRLLLAEIEHNAEVIRTIADRRGDRTMDWVSSPDLPLMKAATWHEVRGRAAELLPVELMGVLNDYYSPLETLLTLLRFQDLTNDHADRELRGFIAEQLPNKRVAATRNPYRGYLEAAIAARESARDGIAVYVTLSRTEALILAVARWLETLKKHEASVR